MQRTSKNLSGWAAIEYIIGAVLIASIVATLLGVFKEKMKTAVEDQINFDMQKVQDEFQSAK